MFSAVSFELKVHSFWRSCQINLKLKAIINHFNWIKINRHFIFMEEEKHTFK